MKKIALTMVTLSCLIFTGWGDNVVVGNLSSFGTGYSGISERTNVTVVLKLISPTHRVHEGRLISDDDLFQVTDNSGDFGFTNVIWGRYKLQLQDRSSTVFMLNVYTNTTGTVQFGSLIGAGQSPPNPATNYYTMPQVDAVVTGAPFYPLYSNPSNYVTADQVGPLPDNVLTNDYDGTISATGFDVQGGTFYAPEISTADGSGIYGVTDGSSLTGITTNAIDATFHALLGSGGSTETVTASNGIVVVTNSSDYRIAVDTGTIATLAAVAASNSAAASAWAAADTVVSNRIPRVKPHINVLDYGALPAACSATSDSYDGSSIAPSDNAFVAAIAAAYASGGKTNTVYFPAGIYKLTNTSWTIPEGVNIEGDGILYPGGYPNIFHVGNTYSLLWMVNTNATGLMMTSAADQNQSIKNIQLVGYSLNPVAGPLSASSASSDLFAKCGLQIGSASSSWTGGELVERVGLFGYRVGLRTDSGQSLYIGVCAVACDVGFASVDPTDDSAMKSQMITAGYGSIWSNSLAHLPAFGGWEYAPADNAKFLNCNLSWRSNGVAYVFQGLRNVSIEHDTSYNYAMFGLWQNTAISVFNTFNEVSDAQRYGATNLITTLSSCIASFRDCSFNYNGHGGPGYIPTNVYGHNMTNFALIRDTAITGPTIFEFSSVNVGIPQTVEGVGLPVLIRAETVAGGRTTTLNTRGLIHFAYESPPRLIRLPDVGTFSKNDQFVGGFSLLQNTNLPPYQWRNYGSPSLTMGAPDYLSWWISTNSTYHGGIYPSPYSNAARVRALQSDPFFPGVSTPKGGYYDAAIPENYTADTLTVRSNFVGNGASLTNLGTNSLSAEAHLWYTTNGGGSVDLSAYLTNSYDGTISATSFDVLGGTFYAPEISTADGSGIYGVTDGSALTGLPAPQLTGIWTNGTVHNQTNTGNLTFSGSGKVLNLEGNVVTNVVGATVTNLTVPTRLLVGDGTSSAPGIARLSDPDDGIVLGETITFYRDGVASIGVSVSGGYGQLKVNRAGSMVDTLTMELDGRLRIGRSDNVVPVFMNSSLSVLDATGGVIVSGTLTATNGVTTVNGGITNGGPLVFTGTGQRFVGTNYFTGTNLQVFVNGQSFWIPLGQTNAP